MEWKSREKEKKAFSILSTDVKEKLSKHCFSTVAYMQSIAKKRSSAEKKTQFNQFSQFSAKKKSI